MLQEANVRKMLVDGEQWACWHGYHIPVSEDYTAIWTPLGTEMCWKTGKWLSAKHQLTYLWNDGWFTIHIGYTAEGKFVSGYCDVVLPSNGYSNVAQELSYTDLYVDVVVREDYSVYTKDHEVFDRAAARFPIVERTRKQSFTMLDWLEEHANKWTGPFALFPRQLTRTDFERLSPDEACAIMQTSV
jgi:protein associated with RNAse G/E